jgi:hypothetical protein
MDDGPRRISDPHDLAAVRGQATKMHAKAIALIAALTAIAYWVP